MVIDTNKFLVKNEENEREFADGMNFAEQKLSDLHYAVQGDEEEVKVQVSCCLDAIENDIRYSSREKDTAQAYFEGIKAVFNLFLEGHN